MVGISAQYSSKISKRYLFWCQCLCDILAILNEYFTNIRQAVILATYWNNMLHMSAQCYEHRFGYCTNAKTGFNVHFGAILAERRVLLGKKTEMWRAAGTGNSQQSWAPYPNLFVFRRFVLVPSASLTILTSNLNMGQTHAKVWS